MINYKTIIALISFSIILSGCLKPLSLKKTPDNFKPIKQRVLNIHRKDNGAIYQQGMRVGLFEDTTAKYIGDVLTIILIENTNASAISWWKYCLNHISNSPGDPVIKRPITTRTPAADVRNPKLVLAR